MGYVGNGKNLRRNENMAEETQVIQEAPESTNADGVSSNEDSSIQESNNANDTAWIGAAKKKSYDKGRKEGYEQAMKEFRESMNNEESNGQSNQTAKPEHVENRGNVEKLTNNQNVPQNTDNSETNGNPYSQQMVETAQRVNREAKHAHIAQMGKAQYPDYTDKISDYAQKSMAEKQAGSNDMEMAMLLAAEIGDQNLVYKLASDENFQKEILNSNPRQWASKLTSFYSPANNVSQVNGGSAYHMKTGAPPIDSLPKSSSYGEISKMTSAQKRAKIKNAMR
jgi:hypothetical protein